MRQQTGNKGFTLIELLIVIGIIGFLAAAVLVAVDPVKRIQDARDSRRYSEVNAILNAILTKQVDDRALYNGTQTAPIITSQTAPQVIVTSDVGIDCDTPASAPACPGKAGIATTDGKACVTNLSGVSVFTATDIDSAAAVVTGTGTAFNTQLAVGDVVTMGANSCTVLSIQSATQFTCAANPTPGAFTNQTSFTVERASAALYPTYIAQIPLDPTGGTPTAGNLAIGATNSGYYLQRTNGNRLEVGACNPEQTASISVKR